MKGGMWRKGQEKEERWTGGKEGVREKGKKGKMRGGLHFRIL